MNHKINLIIPYFGKLPNYFPLFLASCAYNPKIHWTIITDDTTPYQYPPNVTKHEMAYQNLVNQIHTKLDSNIPLESPYKLCDLKPAYGYLFAKLNEGYDYWGYCDIDVIYGNIEKYLPEEAFECAKIFSLGHFTLIKNEEKYNTMFMQNINQEPYYKKAFSSKEAFCFDEKNPFRPNIETIFESQGEKIYHADVIADIYAATSNFKIITDYQVEKKKNSFFVWNKGTLKRYYLENNQIKEREYMYIHLQKRKMKIKLSTEKIDTYKIIPNSFEPLEVPLQEIPSKFHKIKKKHGNLNYFKVRYSNLKTKVRRLLSNGANI